MSLLQSLIPTFTRPVTAEGATCSSQNAESTPGTVPIYTLQEKADAYALLVQLPGVNKTGLTITEEDGVLTIHGERTWRTPAGWTALYRETSDLPFELSLRHEHAIDVDKIHAELSDGVLRASLPKAEARKPRKIAVA